MSNITTQLGQSLADIALQECGSVEAMFDIMRLNNLQELPIQPQTLLQLPPVRNAEMVTYFQTHRITIATFTPPVALNDESEFSDEFNFEYY